MKKTVILNSECFNSGSYFQLKEGVAEYNKYIKDESKKDTTPTKKKRGRKKKGKMYFTEETENAIVRYNNEEDVETRHKIYEDEIKYSIEKLAENIINTFKFMYLSEQYKDIKVSVVSKMIIEMDKYDQSKGKAFSYFSIIAKNYLIIYNNEAYKELKMLESTDNNEYFDFDIKDVSPEIEEKNDEISSFIQNLTDYWENNIALTFKKKRDVDIAFAIIELFRNAQSLELFNKKALYLLIREMTGHKTLYITGVVNQMQKQYETIKHCYFNKKRINGDINEYF